MSERLPIPEQVIGLQCKPIKGIVYSSELTELLEKEYPISKNCREFMNEYIEKLNHDLFNFPNDPHIYPDDDEYGQ